MPLPLPRIGVSLCRRWRTTISSRTPSNLGGSKASGGRSVTPRSRGFHRNLPCLLRRMEGKLEITTRGSSWLREAGPRLHRGRLPRHRSLPFEYSCELTMELRNDVGTRVEIAKLELSKVEEGNLASLPVADRKGRIRDVSGKPKWESWGRRPRRQTTPPTAHAHCDGGVPCRQSLPMESRRNSRIGPPTDGFRSEIEGPIRRRSHSSGGRRQNRGGRGPG